MQLKLSASPRQFLRLLLWLRVAAVIGQALTIIIVVRLLQIALPLLPLACSIAALGVAAALTALRLRSTLPPTQLEIGAQLLIDIGQLTVLLYLSGGTTNPFASLYLIPIALAAVGLGWRYLGAVSLISVAAYAWLITHFLPLKFSQPLIGRAGPADGSMALMPLGSRAFDLHMAGMQVTFLLSCALLASALSFMAGQIRRRDRLAATLREEALRHEHLSAMGVLAAGTAHELSTPLLSMSLLVEELQAAPGGDAQSRADLELLGQQIQICKNKLSRLLQTARQPRVPLLRNETLQALLRQALDPWRLMRPAVRLEVLESPEVCGAMLRVDEGFSQALTSVLDNAADASAALGSDRIRLCISRDADHVQLAIEDEGSGLDSHLQQQAGKAAFTTKAQGAGLGLILSHANLNRMQGELQLAARRGGGTRTLITLPAHFVHD